MPFRMDVMITATMTLLLIMPNARAGMPHALGRHCGVGWGDGYHAHGACPPTQHALLHQQSPAPQAAPWWMIPSSQTERPESESLPPPAIKEPGVSRAFPASGPSLFRQPGAGSQATASAASGGTIR